MLINYQIRNNFWGKTNRQIDSIINSKKLICPWNHFFEIKAIINKEIILNLPELRNSIGKCNINIEI